MPFHGVPEGMVAEQAKDGIAQSGHVPRRHEQAGPAIDNHLGNAPDRGCHHSSSAAGRLDEHGRQCFSFRGQDHEGGGSHDGGHITSPTGEDDMLADSGRCRLSPQLPHVLPGADKEQTCLRVVPDHLGPRGNRR